MRLVAFFLLVFFLASVLGRVPVIGPLFHGTGILGLLLAAALASAVLTRLGAQLWARRRLRAELAALGAVESAHNRGKMGMLYLAARRPRAALAPLEEAARGEPDVAEWHYRLGLARLATGALEPALADFERCVALDAEHAYGAAMMRRAECLQRLGRPAEALAALETLERNHGPSPESACRRGLALRAQGRKAEARAVFRQALELARHAPRYQRRAASVWALRAGLARWL